MDINKLASKLTVDVIAEAAFGCDSKSFVQETSEFEDMACKLLVPMNFIQVLKMMAVMIQPKIEKYIGTRFFSQESDAFFSRLIDSSMKYRKENQLKGNDFLQLMMQVRDGQMRHDNDSELNQLEKEAVLKNVDDKANFDDESIIANLLLFFIAGFETTKSFLIFALYNLALNPQVQDKLLDEILKTQDSDENFSYESVNGMEYLEKFTNGEINIILNQKLNDFFHKFYFCLVLECFRMYPSGFATERLCTKTYKIPNTKVEIKKGTVVILPVCGIHQDPKIYPNPTKFDPERFNAENKGKRSPYHFIPFGHGPRNCIGMISWL